MITTDPRVQHNKPEDLQKILDIRLYPALRAARAKENRDLSQYKQEMVAYYRSAGSILIFEFTIPSSATYYLAEDRNGHFFVIMAGLVSRENIIAQLLTLKLAQIPLKKIEIIGDISHFRTLVQQDMEMLIHTLPNLQVGNHILIVAGCGLEEKVSKIIMHEFKDLIGTTRAFKGNIISLCYTPLTAPLNNIDGFISLNLNYGEIMEAIVSLLLESAGCKYIFTGGAGGYIPRGQEGRPAIGSRLMIRQSMNPRGELAKIESKNLLCTIDQKLSDLHLQIPSIFLETYDWLEKAKQYGTSIDVETFYIIRAIQNYNAKKPDAPVKANCGYFVSDYVGEEPLREYSKVYQHYETVLSHFLNAVIKPAKLQEF